MPDRHGEFVPDVPEVKPDPDYRQCRKYDGCKRRDGHAGSCLPCPHAVASIQKR